MITEQRPAREPLPRPPSQSGVARSQECRKPGWRYSRRMVSRAELHT